MTLAIEDVSKTFPGQRALDGVSLSVEPGEIHALLGENGSGKSTLIRILAGYHLPDPGGSVRIGGTPLALGSPRASGAAGLRFVHQRLALVPELSAVENMALETGYGRPWSIDWRRQAAETRRLLARLHVDIDIWRPVREHKPVERSAIAIARALRDGEQASTLVLDEPTAALPAAEVRQLFRVVRESVATGIGVMYVSHRLDEIFEIGDRVSVLRDGRLQGTERVADLSKTRLVEMIVGRELAPSWEKPVREEADVEATTLAVESLTTERLNGVSLAVRAGEIVAIVGVAGSGREDVAPALVGAMPQVAGTVAVAGTPLHRLDPRAARDAGLVLARGNTLPGSATAPFTIRENLSLASLARYTPFGRLRGRRERADASDLIASLDVRPPEPDRPYSLLSGGNQQKVILGKWLNSRPKVLVLEEPTAGVDVGARQAIYERIVQEAERGLAVVVCSSDLEDVVSLADRAVVLRDGEIAAELRGAELTEQNLLLVSTGAEPEPSKETAAHA